MQGPLPASSVKAGLDPNLLGRTRMGSPERRSACAWCPEMPRGGRQAQEAGPFPLPEPVALATDDVDAAGVEQPVVDLVLPQGRGSGKASIVQYDGHETS